MSADLFLGFFSVAIKVNTGARFCASQRERLLHPIIYTGGVSIGRVQNNNGVQSKGGHPASELQLTFGSERCDFTGGGPPVGGAQAPVSPSNEAETWDLPWQSGGLHHKHRVAGIGGAGWGGGGGGGGGGRGGPSVLCGGCLWQRFLDRPPHISDELGI